MDLLARQADGGQHGGQLTIKSALLLLLQMVHVKGRGQGQMHRAEGKVITLNWKEARWWWFKLPANCGAMLIHCDNEHGTTSVYSSAQGCSMRLVTVRAGLVAALMCRGVGRGAAKNDVACILANTSVTITTAWGDFVSGVLTSCMVADGSYLGKALATAGPTAALRSMPDSL
jgi:hypothetical protein